MKNEHLNTFEKELKENDGLKNYLIQVNYYLLLLTNYYTIILTFTNVRKRYYLKNKIAVLEVIYEK